MATKRAPQRRRRRTSLDRTHRTGVALSAVLALLGLAGIVTGAYSWALERPDWMVWGLCALVAMAPRPISHNPSPLQENNV